MAASANPLPNRAIPHQFVPMPVQKKDLAGKLTGSTQHEIIDCILDRITPRRPGVPWPLWSPPISIQDFADFSHAPNSCAHFRAAVEDLEKRKIIASTSSAEIGAKAKPKAHRAKCYRLLPENWAGVEYPQPKPATEAKPEPPAPGPQQVIGPKKCATIGTLANGLPVQLENHTDLPVTGSIHEDESGLGISVHSHNKELTNPVSPVGGRNRKEFTPATPASDERQPKPTAVPASAAAAGAERLLIEACKRIGLVAALDHARAAIEQTQDLPIDYLVRKLADRVQRGLSGQTTAFTSPMLPKFAGEQYDKWQAEKLAAASPEQPKMHPKDRERMDRITQGAAALRRRRGMPPL